ncbi:MAG: DUF1768 domain-containing protein [Clostridia bacterium]|nr:DUF1768 domain-containing protein [Clostridia bacterium]
MKYSREDLSEWIGIGSRPSFISFWGHIPGSGKVDKACLSQWYDCIFEVEGVRYHTAEQYMMAQKAALFSDRRAYAGIMASDSTADCGVLGRKIQGFDPKVWDRAKYGIVLKGSIAKFGQNPKLWSYLDSTGDSVLVEACTNDGIWGVGLGIDDPRTEDPSEWRGRNLLGFALMETRDILRRREEFEDGQEDGVLWERFTDCYIKDGDPPDYTNYEGIGIFREGDHFGILHPIHHTVVFPARFDDCEPMKTGFIREGSPSMDYSGDRTARIENAVFFARVRCLDRYGAVDSEGRVITPCKWDWIDAYGNAREGGLWGYVDLITGEEIPPQWPRSRDLRPGRPVWSAETETDWELGFLIANHVTHWETTMQLFREEQDPQA